MQSSQDHQFKLVVLTSQPYMGLFFDAVLEDGGRERRSYVRQSIAVYPFAHR